MADRRGEAFLDRPAARAVAVLCFLLAAGALAYIHRGDLFGAPGRGVTDEAVAACVSARMADIERLHREGAVTTAQVEAFRTRLEPVCRAEISASPALQ